jgi:hypothetical protein
MIVYEQRSTAFIPRPIIHSMLSTPNRSLQFDGTVSHFGKAPRAMCEPIGASLAGIKEQHGRGE